MDRADVIILGGGAAGLSAALILARARRRVLVLDAHRPRNRFAAHMHGVLSRDGYSPLDLVADGRREVRAVDGVIVETTVVEARAIDGVFQVVTDSGARATGILASVRRSETSNKTPVKPWDGLPPWGPTTTIEPAGVRGQASIGGGGPMHRTTRLAAGAVALLLVSGSSVLAQSPAASDEAWTKSDVLAGFDPLSVDLEGSTPGPNGEESVAASDIEAGAAASTS